MSWVKSPEEIARIEERLASSAFYDGRFLALTFLTRPEFIAEVLPPPLEPPAEPVVSVSVSSFGSSNCVGGFGASAVNVRARYRDIEGEYCLTMPLTTDSAIIFGRELFGEPKKQAAIRLDGEGDTMTGSVSRLGVEVIRLEAQLDRTVEVPGPTVTRRFHFKFMHAADGHGLEFDPILVLVEFTNRIRLLRAGEGKVTFTGSPHDPVGEIEVVELGQASYGELDLFPKARRLTTVPRDQFLPYSFQNIDDYSSPIGVPAPSVYA